MAAIPESTKISLRQKLGEHARQRWPGITEITTRFHGQLAYIAAQTDDDSEPVKLFRLRYGGYANMWGLAIWRASHDDYQPSRTLNGTTSTTPQEALDLTAALYLPATAETRRTNEHTH